MHVSGTTSMNPARTTQAESERLRRVLFAWIGEWIGEFVMPILGQIGCPDNHRVNRETHLAETIYS